MKRMISFAMTIVMALSLSAMPAFAEEISSDNSSVSTMSEFINAVQLYDTEREAQFVGY